jgi:hypothetical protein
MSLAIAFSLGGCNGEVRTRLLTIRGVFGYYDKTVLEIDKLTSLTDSKGVPVAAACNPVYVQKVVTVTDQQHPIVIWYDHGLLEANQFSVQLASGVFKAINSQSTPDQGKTLANLGSHD